MSKNTSVVLGKEHNRFIKSQLRKGRVGSASESVRAGLRLLEEQELKIERLRSALREGEASGEPSVFDMDSYIAERRKTTA